MAEKPKRRTTHPIRAQRRQIAAERQPPISISEMTLEQCLERNEVLDNRLGKGQGAKKERSKIYFRVGQLTG